MEPVTAIVTALALGAAVSLQEKTEQVIKDGYTTLKTLIMSKFPQLEWSLIQLEQAPDSMARRAVVEEDLIREGAAHSTEILQEAKVFLDLIAQRAPNTAEVIGVDLKYIVSASLHIVDISSSGSGVRTERVDIVGDIIIQDVRMGDRFENIHGSTIVNRSLVEKS